MSNCSSDKDSNEFYSSEKSNSENGESEELPKNSLTLNKRTGKGRVKIDTKQRIEDPKKRAMTASKRKKTFFKMGKELSTMCDLATFVATCTPRGKLEISGHGDFEGVEDFLIRDCIERATHNQHKLNLEDALRAYIILRIKEKDLELSIQASEGVKEKRKKKKKRKSNDVSSNDILENERTNNKKKKKKEVAKSRGHKKKIEKVFE